MAALAVLARSVTKSLFLRSSKQYVGLLSVASQHGSKNYSRQRTPAEENNYRQRLDLATAYRLLNELGMNEGVCNHLTMMAPARDGSGQELMLLIPYGMLWSEVTASSLLALNDKNELVEGEGQNEISASTIHRGLHDKIPTAKCVMHSHTPYITALGCLEDPELKMCHQNSLRFYRGLAYDNDYTGIATEVAEGQRLANCMEKGDAVLIMANHGVVTTGPTVAAAFDYMYYLERAAQVQVLAMSTGEKLKIIPDHICQANYEAIDKFALEYAEAHFKAQQNRLLRKFPDLAK